MEANTGSRGITKPPPGVSKLTTLGPLYRDPDKLGTDLIYTEVDVDSFPSADGRWMPPLHGDDVECVYSPNAVLKETEEHRRDLKRFLKTLEADHASSSPDGENQDLMPCFEIEEGLQPPDTRRANRHAAGSIGVDPAHAENVSLMKTTLSTDFYHSWEWGHLVHRPDSESEGLERHMSAIPEHLGEPKRQFQERNGEARGAVRNGQWEMACQHYEECLRILVLGMENGLWTHIQTWLLLYVCIPLVHIYQLWFKNYPKCLKLYDLMLQQLNREDEHDNEVALGQLYYEILWHRRLVLFHWSHTLEEEEGNRRGLLVQLAFNVVAVQNKAAQGFVVLQRMINHWGHRSDMNSGEGDMRVAFCFNMQRLWRVSQQWLPELVNWEWINNADASKESKIRWKLQDVEPLYYAGMVDKVRILVEEVEILSNQLEGGTLETRILKYDIDRWVATLHALSDPTKADERLKSAKRKLKNEDKRWLATMNLVLTEVIYERIQGNQILEDSPFGVEVAINLKPFIEEAKELLTALDSSWFCARLGSPRSFGTSRRLLLRGSLNMLEAVGGTLETEIGDRVAGLVSAKADFEESLKLMNHSVSTLQQNSKLEVKCRFHIGLSYFHSWNYMKDFNLKYDEDSCYAYVPSSMSHQYLYENNINAAIEHFRIALDLATKHGHDDLLMTIIRHMGLAYSYKSSRLIRLGNEAFKIWPYFRIPLATRIPEDVQTSTLDLKVDKDCGNRQHLHRYILILAPDEATLEIWHGLKDPKATGENSSLYRVWTRTVNFGLWKEEFIRDVPNPVISFDVMYLDFKLDLAFEKVFETFTEDINAEIQRSIDYLTRSFEMEFENQLFDPPKDGQLIISPAEWARVEDWKSDFTMVQVLIWRQYVAGEDDIYVFAESKKNRIKEANEIQSAFRPVYNSNVLQPEEKEKEIRRIYAEKSSTYIDRYIGKYIADKSPTIMQESPQDLTLCQKGLIWSERGRSRVLMHQLVHKDSTVPIKKLVNFNFSDEESWAILREAQLACGVNTVFVEYTFSAAAGVENGVNNMIYVVTKEGEVHMRDCKPINSDKNQMEALRESLKKIHARLSSANEFQADTIQTDLEKLYAFFIEPISDLLKPMKPEDKLVFALDDVLTNVPFSILRDVETGRYLIENHTICFTPSLRVLKECRERLKSMDTALHTVEPSVALGDPAYKSKNERLVYTHDEVTSIPKFFNTNCVKVFTGNDATIDNLLKSAKLPNPENMVQGFVHIAAHGLVDKRYKSGALKLAHPKAKPQGAPDSSSPTDRRGEGFDVEEEELEEAPDHDTPQTYEMLGVVRGGSISETTKGDEDSSFKKEKETGILRSENIVKCGFELRFRFAVLSACNTAKGSVLRTENVVGLPRAFLAAGVPCVVASQWKLEDKSSAELMKEFYNGMSRGSDTATALRAAMLRMMDRSLEEPVAELMKAFNEERKGGADEANALSTAMLKTIDQSLVMASEMLKEEFFSKKKTDATVLHDVMKDSWSFDGEAIAEVTKGFEDDHTVPGKDQGNVQFLAATKNQLKKKNWQRLEDEASGELVIEYLKERSRGSDRAKALSLAMKNQGWMGSEDEASAELMEKFDQNMEPWLEPATDALRFLKLHGHEDANLKNEEYAKKMIKTMSIPSKEAPALRDAAKSQLRDRRLVDETSALFMIEYSKKNILNLNQAERESFVMKNMTDGQKNLFCTKIKPNLTKRRDEGMRQGKDKNTALLGAMYKTFPILHLIKKRAIDVEDPWVHRELSCGVVDEAIAELRKEYFDQRRRRKDEGSALRDAATLKMKNRLVARSVYKWGGFLVWGLPTVTIPPSMLRHQEV